MTQTAQKLAGPADDTKKAAAPAPAAAVAAPDASGSRAGTVTIKSAEAALMLGETAAYHSIRSGADEIATWINTGSDLVDTDRILIVEGGHPWDDSLAYHALRDELDRVKIDAQRREASNDAILNPPRDKGLDGGVGARAVVASPMVDLLASIAGLSDPLKTVVGILSTVNTAAGYFRADYTLASARTSPSDDALRAMLAEKITRCEVYLLSGATYAPEADGVDLMSGLGALYRLGHETLAAQRDLLAKKYAAPLAAALGALKARVAAAEAERAEIKARLANLDKQLIANIGNAAQVELLNKEIAAEKAKDIALVSRIAADSEKSNEITAALTGIQAALDATDALVKRIDAFLQKADAGPPKLADALRHEWMARLGITHLLQASCISAGHETLTEQGPIYKIAQMQRLYLLGSSVVSYKLTRVTGLKVKTDTLARASRMAIKLSDGSVADIESLKVA